MTLPQEGKLPVASLAAVIGGLTVVAMLVGYNSPLFSTRLDEMGYSDRLIGINAAAHSIAPFIVAPLAPLILARYGLARTMIFAALAESALYLLCMVVPGFWGWSTIRLAMGAIGTTAWIAGEVWIAQAATDATRGRVLAIYNSAFGIGVAAGPAFLAWVGHGGNLPFMLAALLLVVGVVPIIWARRLAPAMDSEHRTPSMRALLDPLKGAPVPMMLNLFYALIFLAIWTFLPVYAIDTGYDVTRAYEQLSFFALGGVMLQLPVGYLVDRGDSRFIGVTLMLATLVWVLGFAWAVHTPLFDFAYFFFLGGISSGVYVVALSIIGKQYRGTRLAAAITVYTLMWSVGSLIGPPVIGLITDLLGPAGLQYALIAFSLIFLPFVVRDWWRSRTPDPTSA